MEIGEDKMRYYRSQRSNSERRDRKSAVGKLTVCVIPRADVLHRKGVASKIRKRCPAEPGYTLHRSAGILAWRSPQCNWTIQQPIASRKRKRGPGLGHR